MNRLQSTVTDEPTDALFDTSNAALAVRFGARTVQQIRIGSDPSVAARLAFSYAFMSRPWLRVEWVHQ